MNNRTEYSWYEIQPIARDLCCEINGEDYYVWGTAAEMAWAEMAWNALSRNGLTTYTGECEKRLTGGQILTMAAMFCQFIELFHGKTVVVNYEEWFEQMNLDIFGLEIVLGKTLAREYCEKEIYHEVICQDDNLTEDIYEYEVYVHYGGDDHDSDVTSGAVKELISIQREPIFTALVAEFGGIDSLHLSLLRTQQRCDFRNWIEKGMSLKCCNEM